MQTINRKTSSLFIITLLLLLVPHKGNSQSLALKTDMFTGVAFYSPNLGLDFRLSDAFSAGFAVNYNPLPRTGDVKWRHLMLNTGIRYWTDEIFSGHFFGFQVFGGQFNLSKIKLPFNALPGLHGTRYEGFLGGASLSYGYQWILSPRWGIEVEAGLGVAYMSYDIMKSYQSKEKVDSKTRWNITPTKCSVSLVYIIK